MPVRLTAEELAAKWASRLKGSVAEIQAGVERVTVAPGVEAAKKADKWQARISAADTKAKWARRIAAVSLDDWKSAIINKGIPRIAAGVDQAIPKMVRFGTQLIPHQNRLLSEIAAMPDLTLEHSIQRMASWVRGMAKFELKE